MVIVSINGVKVDAEQGFDVMRRDVVIEHLDSYELAKRKAAERKGQYIRYWTAK